MIPALQVYAALCCLHIKRYLPCRNRNVWNCCCSSIDWGSNMLRSIPSFFLRPWCHWYFQSYCCESLKLSGFVHGVYVPREGDPPSFDCFYFCQKPVYCVTRIHRHISPVFRQTAGFVASLWMGSTSTTCTTTSESPHEDHEIRMMVSVATRTAV